MAGDIPDRPNEKHPRGGSFGRAESTHQRDAKVGHAGDCTIYAAMDNGEPTDGICTCGFGLNMMRKGIYDHMYSRLHPRGMQDVEKRRIIAKAKWAHEKAVFYAMISVVPIAIGGLITIYGNFMSPIVFGVSGVISIAWIAMSYTYWWESLKYLQIVNGTLKDGW